MNSKRAPGEQRIPISYLFECFDIDRERGLLTWKSRPASHFSGSEGQSRATNARCAGRQVKRKDGFGYFQIDLSYQGKVTHLRVHRIVWAMLTGSWPTMALDHINGIRTDNRLSNLREATWSQNQANRRTFVTNRIGLKGVHKRYQRYAAQIQVQGRYIWLGTFDTPELAHAAYREAAQKYHGQFAFHNRTEA